MDMKKIIFFSLCLAFIAMSCKNKNTAKTIEGTWAEVKVDGVDVPVGSQDKIVFGSCKGGKNAECDLTLIDAGGTIFDSYSYTIEDKGETLVLILGSGLVTIKSNNTITSLTDNSMTIDWNGTYIGVYSKQ